MRVIIDGEWTYWCDFADEVRVGQFVKLPSKVRGGVFCGEVTSLKSDYSGVIKAAIEPMPQIQSFEQKLAYNTVQKMLDKVILADILIELIKELIKFFSAQVRL